MWSLMAGSFQAVVYQVCMIHTNLHQNRNKAAEKFGGFVKI